MVMFPQAFRVMTLTYFVDWGLKSPKSHKGIYENNFLSAHTYMNNWSASLENPNTVTNRRPSLDAEKLL